MRHADKIVSRLLEDDDDFSVKDFAGDPNAIWVRIEKKPEIYYGEPTGQITYTCDISKWIPRLGSVLGRGSSEREAIEDFVRRARGDGHKVNMTQINIEYQIDSTVEPRKTGRNLF